MRGKKICNSLKKVRLDIAKANGITLDIPECTHKGECLGTCPRCEWEVTFLERELEKRRRSGVKIVLAGVSAGLVAVNAVACGPVTELDGDVAADSSVGARITSTTEEADGNIPPIDGDPSEETPLETEQVVGQLAPESELAGAVPLDTGDETEEIFLDGDIAFIPETEDETDEVFVTAGVMPAPEDFGEDE